jgi:hypothetical protein
MNQSNLKSPSLHRILVGISITFSLFYSLLIEPFEQNLKDSLESADK